MMLGQTYAENRAGGEVKIEDWFPTRNSDRRRQRMTETKVFLPDKQRFT